MANNAILVPMKGRGGAAPEYGNTQAPVAAGANASARLQGGAVQIANAYNLAHYKGEDGGFDWEMLDKAARAGQRLTGTVDDIYWTYQGAKAKDAYNRYLQAMQQKQAELSELKGEAALGKNGVQAQLREWASRNREALTKDLGNDAKVLFGRHADMEDSKMSAWARRVEFSEMNNYIDSVDEGRLHMLMETAQRDPSQISAGLGQAKAVIDAMAQRKGLAKEYADAKFANYQDKMYSAVLSNCFQTGDIEGAKAILMQHSAGMSPGVRAKAFSAFDGATVGRVRDLISAGKYDEAESLLRGVSTGTYGGQGGIITTRGKKGSIADDQNNPWNLSKRGSSDATPQRQRFQHFETPEAGTYAAYNQFVRYNQGKLGSTIKGPDASGKITDIPMNTLRGMVYKWQSGKRDKPATVVADMARAGLEVDKPFDATSPEGKMMVSGMMSKLAINESGWRITPKQILQVVESGGKSPQGNGETTPSFRLTTEGGTAELQRVMAGLDKKRQEAMVRDASDGILLATQGLTGDNRVAQAITLAEKASADPAVQQAIVKRVSDTEKWEKTKREAEGITQARDLLEAWQAKPDGMNIQQFLESKLADGNIPDATKRALGALVNGKVEDNANSRTAQQAIYKSIDQMIAQGMPREEIRRNIEISSLGTLTTEQTKACLKYLDNGGKKKGVSFAKVQTLLNGLLQNAGELDNGKSIKMPAGLYDAVIEQLEDGRTYSDADLQTLIARVAMRMGKSEGLIWNSEETYLDALKEGRGDKWTPTLSDDEKAKAKAFLESHGEKDPSDERIAQFLKFKASYGLPKGSF